MAQVMLREYLQEIEDALSTGHVDDAANKCQHILARFPESLEVQRLMGEVYLARGQMDDAQQALDWILTNDPENVIAYCDRALISERQMDLDTALDCYQQAYELSRGNRDIRQQFNMLSIKAGQQGFMFSRAGLARLYMRGGLLPQAIQEWDAVLTVSPDRLDARTGLLEAYWREELYDEAEGLAQQILQDVPGCVKALLLLAHITAPKNMQQAREYIQRAELLDPDLLMAQELFEDMLMSQQGHPFLKLLKKTATMIDIQQSTTQAPLSGVPAEPVLAHASTPQEASRVPEMSIYDTPTSANLFDWNNPSSWRSAGETPSQEDALPTWSHDTFSDAWTLPVQPQEVQVPQKQESTSVSDQKPDDASTASLAPTASTALPAPTESSATVVPPVQQEEHVWRNLDSLAGLRRDDAWRNAPEPQQAPEPLWRSDAQDEAVASPPAWLNMLTQNEIRGESQPADVTPALPEEPYEPSVATSQSDTLPTLDDENIDDSWRSALQASLDSTTDEEPFSFGPEWLKSLGAAELEPDVQEQSLPSSPAQPEMTSQVLEGTPTLSHEPELAPATYTPQETASTSFQEPVSSEHSWLDALSTDAEYNQHSELAVVNTLENLEQSLLSEGFVPLEPNSLAIIARSQDASSLDIPSVPLSSSPTEEVHEEEHFQQPTLSSALEQLGNLATPRVSNGSSELITPTTETTSVQSDDEPLWATDLRTVPAARQDQYEGLWQGAFDPAPVSGEQHIAPQEQQATQPYYVNDSVIPAFEPTQVPQPVQAPDIPALPLHRADAFFDGELETTMKRPAVRLEAIRQAQSLQSPQYPSSSTSYVSTNKGRGTQATGGNGKEGAQRLQERLVLGYQHQLVGDYDEAMQEYRVIVKNAPELLDEVVSNVRALLKIAPQYSPGYRVLGDAYMRQGEYLQAMEAYNKALTMAKKARV